MQRKGGAAVKEDATSTRSDSENSQPNTRVELKKPSQAETIISPPSPVKKTELVESANSVALEDWEFKPRSNKFIEKLPPKSYSEIE